MRLQVALAMVKACSNTKLKITLFSYVMEENQRRLGTRTLQASMAVALPRTGASGMINGLSQKGSASE